MTHNWKPGDVATIVLDGTLYIAVRGHAAWRDRWFEAADAEFIATAANRMGALLDAAEERNALAEESRRCGARHPDNPSAIPCMLDRDGHGTGLHWSSTGCAGSAMSWPTAEAEVSRLRAELAAQREGVGTGAGGGDAPALTEATSRVNRSVGCPEDPAQAHLLAYLHARVEEVYAELAEVRAVIEQVTALRDEWARLDAGKSGVIGWYPSEFNEPLRQLRAALAPATQREEGE